MLRFLRLSFSAENVIRFIPLTLLLAIVVAGCGSSGEETSEADSPHRSASERILFPVEQDGNWGYIDRSGTVVIEPQFEQAWQFVERRALVKQQDQYGFIDTSGAFVVRPRYHDAWHFSNGLAPVLEDSLWGFIDRSGDMVVDPKFSLAPEVVEEADRSLQDRDAILKRTARDGQFGFQNQDGQMVITPRFDQAWYFRDGRARVKVDSLWGYIDRSGDLAIKPAFPRAWDFRNGLARVELRSGHLAYIDTSGATVWP
ncbi:hypothetical protein CRI94_10415 [Longibacter salinarum]|uniref:WG repeat-containing protein n=1 Tax=Longibacter salinarum TaxID=1850348 RepID=A0A2A8CWR6_9BACT|nr:WG repeat-containing protein [Longibacter salinarum]PEN13060.1 hypothetical protein CRI94_10415 [Longibacter salinarum]